MHSHLTFDRFLVTHGVGLILIGVLVGLFGAALERPQAVIMFLGLMLVVFGVLLSWPSRVRCRITPCRKSNPHR